jgi:hypothetical protein
MERGLLWLPLLAAFIWLAWSGWNEYQKVEAYRHWASQFERAKYDIYAVLGQKGSDLTWGKPTRQGPVELETFSLQDVQAIRLLVDQQRADLDKARHRKVVRSLLNFCFLNPLPPSKFLLQKFPSPLNGESFYNNNYNDCGSNRQNRVEP